jgi:hypothetical protein
VRSIDSKTNPRRRSAARRNGSAAAVKALIAAGDLNGARALARAGYPAKWALDALNVIAFEVSLRKADAYKAAKAGRPWEAERKNPKRRNPYYRSAASSTTSVATAEAAVRREIEAGRVVFAHKITAGPYRLARDEGYAVIEDPGGRVLAFGSSGKAARRFVRKVGADVALQAAFKAASKARTGGW